MSLTKRLTGGVVVVVLFLLSFSVGWLAGRAGIGSPPVDSSDLSELERAFAEQMQKAALVGHFTVAGRDDQAARTDRYDIDSVEKVGADRWRFNTRVRYGSVDATLPIVVPLVWVGDTPMVTLTDYSIPTLGTFTARVMFYGDWYAGTWQHGDIGGLMYGRIERKGG